MKRLLIYVLRDARKADAYVLSALAALAACADRVRLVRHAAVAMAALANGEAVEADFADLGGGYAAGLRGVDVRAWDEIVLASDALMGPVGDVAGMFKTMAARDVSHWCLAGRGLEQDAVEADFITLRPARLRAEMDVAAIFALKLDAAGSYVDFSARRGYAPRVLAAYAAEALSAGCPFFLRDVFLMDYADTLSGSDGGAARRLMDHLRAHAPEQADMAWAHLLRVGNQADIARNLQLTAVLANNCVEDPARAQALSARRILAVFHLYSPDTFAGMRDYARALPENADIVLTTTDEARAAQLRELFGEFAHLTVRVIENRGRDVAAILVGVKDIVFQYDYVFYAHDKKSLHFTPYAVGESFGRKCMENTLGTRQYVINLLCRFEAEPRLGMIFPPEPDAGEYFATRGGEWGPNFGVTHALAGRLGLTVPMSPDKPPFTAMGSCFWFRPQALGPLYAPDWDYADLPLEPLAGDGTLLHAIERVRGYAVQQAGFYSLCALSADYARTELTNMHYYLEGYNRLVQALGVVDSYAVSREFAGRMLRLGAALTAGAPLDEDMLAAERTLKKAVPWPKRLRYRLKRHVPRRLYGALIRIKRAIFGPHGVEYHYEDQ